MYPFPRPCGEEEGDCCWRIAFALEMMLPRDATVTPFCQSLYTSPAIHHSLLPVMFKTVMPRSEETKSGSKSSPVYWIV